MFLFNQLLAVALLFFFTTKENKPLATKTKTELLTAQTWIVKKSVDMENERYNHYERGANNNTHSLDNDELAFANDHSGSYKDITGSAYKLTWTFTNADETEMDVTIQYPQPVTLHYEMIQLNDSGFSATHSYINGNGNRVLASFQRIYKQSECGNEKSAFSY